MPIYEYRCGGCGERFEELVSASAPEAPPCPRCGAGAAERVMSMFATEWIPENVAWHQMPGKHDMGGAPDTRPSVSVPRTISDGPQKTKPS
jgi:putative FmdB family regulatory protein